MRQNISVFFLMYITLHLERHSFFHFATSVGFTPDYSVMCLPIVLLFVSLVSRAGISYRWAADCPVDYPTPFFMSCVRVTSWTDCPCLERQSIPVCCIFWHYWGLSHARVHLQPSFHCSKCCLEKIGTVCCFPGGHGQVQREGGKEKAPTKNNHPLPPTNQQKQRTSIKSCHVPRPLLEEHLSK